MAPPSSDDENGGTPEPPEPPAARQTRSSKRGKPQGSESELSDVRPVKKAKKTGPKSKSSLNVSAKAPNRKPGPKKKVQNLSDNIDSDVYSDPESPVKKRKQPKPKKGKTAEYDENGVEIKAVIDVVFMIPEAATNSNQRVGLRSSHSFEDALETMYETIGCVSVARKPTLAYKLSSTVQKTPAINLRTPKDWSGLITDYTTKIQSKKDLTVAIEVLPENYMFSLRSMHKKVPAIKKGTKKGKMTTIDLENNDTDGDDEGDEGVEDAEKKAMAELDAEYRTCVKCGTTQLCKIDRAGNHVHLTFPQRRAWAVSLACGTHKVTKVTPPQGGLFQMFHNNRYNDGPPAAAPAAYPHSPWYQLPPGHSTGYGIPAYTGYPQPPLIPQFPPAPARQPMMSSDPVEEDGISYPSVITFIETLIDKAPLRVGLHAVGETLDSLHFFEINEITTLTTQELGTEKFGSVVLGDAQFLLKQAGMEVKRLEKQARCARH
ncbi:hypothetical protein K438DRAFT_1985443 [Mycena galopus ATCC 62051]|nr:hypothetical protein K438DRAFT_1985443 [Mycena galopus ATCC 62051]